MRTEERRPTKSRVRGRVCGCTTTACTSAGGVGGGVLGWQAASASRAGKAGTSSRRSETEQLCRVPVRQFMEERFLAGRPRKTSIVREYAGYRLDPSMIGG